VKMKMVKIPLHGEEVFGVKLEYLCLDM